jgi:(1->4)-alpha-D-glucan 1-alpha-D-glucosylmutase
MRGRHRRNSHSFVQNLESWRDGTVKQKLICAALAFRKEAPALFSEGDYLPLEVVSVKATHVTAFMRCKGDEAALVAVPHLSVDLLKDAGTPRIEPNTWGDTRILMPERFVSASFANHLTGTFCEVRSEGLMLSETLGSVPLGLFKAI